MACSFRSSKHPCWLLGSVMACGPSIGENDANGDPSGGTETGTQAGTMVEPDETGEPDPDEPDTEGERACVAGPFEGEIDCSPVGDAYVSFDVEGLPEVFEGECELVETTTEQQLLTVMLDCGGPYGSVSISIQATRTFDTGVEMGEPISVLYHSEWWGEDEPDRYLRLRDREGALVLLAIDGEGLPSFDTEPLELRIPSSSCEGRATECAVVQRSALEISFRGVRGARYYSGSAAALGPFGEHFVVVQHVSRVACWPDCGVNYASWGVRAVIFR